MDRERRAELLRLMMTAQQHRGPDGSGQYSDAWVSMGNNRLAILDIQRGQQPFFSDEPHRVLVYNGEIYNHADLRTELLSQGHHFRTRNDGEVALEAFNGWGVGSFARFNGMFAFALWDRDSRKLYLVRDRLGIKPLYVADWPGGVAFASEIKALRVIPEIDLSVDARGLARYLCFQTHHGEKTLFTHVRQVEPGQYLEINEDLETEEHQFAELDTSIDTTRSFQDWLEEFDFSFRRAVRRHLISDVPVGSYLSGGLDSSLVAWAAQENLAPARLATFTGYFPGLDGYDESPLARETSRLIDSVHHECPITAKDFRDQIGNVIRSLDEPLMGPGAFSQYMVARDAAQHVKVILTGHGGDELFAGYAVYKAALVRAGAWKYRSEILGELTFPDFLRVAYFSLFPLWRPLLEPGLHVFFTPGEIAKLVNGDVVPPDLEEYLMVEARSNSQATADPLTRTLQSYLRGYLPGLFLVEDKVSMAHSLESRTPFCDNELVSLALQIPGPTKLHQGRLKAIPKEFGRDKLPQSLFGQPKRGFPTPIHLWFKGELRDWMEEQLLRRCPEILVAKRVESLWRRFLSSKRDNLQQYHAGFKLFSLLSLSLHWDQTGTRRAVKVA